jgi:flavin reductase (DIM6/NTAB) family NADH-FMN oxidoreductase RutF
MRIPAQARKFLKRLFLGPLDCPQQCPVGLRDPQTDVAVLLHGLGDACDVTHNHFMTCGAPFTIGISFDNAQTQLINENTQLTLEFRQRDGDQRLLGEIALRRTSMVPVGDQQLALFKISNYRNYCLPRAHLWARYLQYAYQRARVHNSDVAITWREIHAMIVFYTCPRPVAFVSVVHENIVNIFPVNLMGPIKNNHFCFALNSATPVANLVNRAGEIALSSIPLEQRSVAFQFGKHHKREGIDLGQLPFTAKTSTALGLPVPEFALRVREMKIESARKLGSHTMFVARIIQDEHWKDDLEFFVEHGIYRAWRENKLDPLLNETQCSNMSFPG